MPNLLSFSYLPFLLASKDLLLFYFKNSVNVLVKMISTNPIKIEEKIMVEITIIVLL